MECNEKYTKDVDLSRFVVADSSSRRITGSDMASDLGVYIQPQVKKPGRTLTEQMKRLTASIDALEGNIDRLNKLMEPLMVVSHNDTPVTTEEMKEKVRDNESSLVKDVSYTCERVNHLYKVISSILEDIQL